MDNNLTQCLIVQLNIDDFLNHGQSHLNVIDSKFSNKICKFLKKNVKFIQFGYKGFKSMHPNLTNIGLT